MHGGRFGRQREGNELGLYWAIVDWWGAIIEELAESENNLFELGLNKKFT